MPLSALAFHDQHGDMTTELISHHSTSPTLPILAPAQEGRLTAGSNRPWLRLMSHLRGHSLDSRLAAGDPPEASRLLAARARWLVSPRTQTELAGNWEAVLERVQQSPTPRSPRVAFRRDRVVTARPEIERLVARLRAPFPTPVRGAAMTSWILEDGTGPLYNPHGRTDLHSAIRQAISHLDPVPLIP
jgi:hypothetical protein